MELELDDVRRRIKEIQERQAFLSKPSTLRRTRETATIQDEFLFLDSELARLQRRRAELTRD